MYTYDAPFMLGLGDAVDSPLTSAGWVGAFVHLGSILKRFSQTLTTKQLIVAITVPQRDFVAALLGTGWMLAVQPPVQERPIEVFRRATRQDHVRGVTDQRIIAGTFFSLDESPRTSRVTFGGRQWSSDFFKSVTILDQPSADLIDPVPAPGFLGVATGAADNWLERLAAPAREVGLIGVAAWLREDSQAVVGDGNEARGVGTPLSHYLLPKSEKSATWATEIISAAQLTEMPSRVENLGLVVLDQYVAIKNLHNVMTPIVVCVIDRSILDDSAAETVLQARLSNSQPLSVRDDLHWAPPSGVEALAFLVAM